MARENSVCRRRRAVPVAVLRDARRRAGARRRRRRRHAGGLFRRRRRRRRRRGDHGHVDGRLQGGGGGGGGGGGVALPEMESGACDRRCQFNSIICFISHRAIQFYTVYQVIYVINKMYKSRAVLILIIQLHVSFRTEQYNFIPFIKLSTSSINCTKVVLF